jgi:hypothetical protein
MFEIKLEEKPLEGLVLEPEKRVTKGRTAEPYTLDGWASLGVPCVVPLKDSSSITDAELRRFLRASANEFCFFLVHLACSFQSADDEPFTKAWVRALLGRADGAKGDRPIAWSMQPDVLYHQVEVTRTAKFSAELKLAAAKIGPSLQSVEKKEKKEVFLQAFNELESNPLWEFQRTSTASIRGKQRLVLVVRMAAGSQGTGTIQLWANVERKKFGIVRYEDAYPSSPSRRFHLP